MLTSTDDHSEMFKNVLANQISLEKIQPALFLLWRFIWQREVLKEDLYLYSLLPDI